MMYRTKLQSELWRAKLHSLPGIIVARSSIAIHP